MWGDEPRDQVRNLSLIITAVTPSLEAHSEPLILRKRKGIQVGVEKVFSVPLSSFDISWLVEVVAPDPNLHFSHDFPVLVSVQIWVCLFVSYNSILVFLLYLF